MKKNQSNGLFVIGFVLVAIVMLVGTGFAFGLAMARLGVVACAAIRNKVELLLLAFMLLYGILCGKMNGIEKAEKINQKEN